MHWQTPSRSTIPLNSATKCLWTSFPCTFAPWSPTSECGGVPEVFEENGGLVWAWLGVGVAGCGWCCGWLANRNLVAVRFPIDPLASASSQIYVSPPWDFYLSDKEHMLHILWKVQLKTQPSYIAMICDHWQVVQSAGRSRACFAKFVMEIGGSTRTCSELVVEKGPPLLLAQQSCHSVQSTWQIK